MKVNRFGMSEKTFMKMVLAWADKTTNDISRRATLDGGYEQRKKELDEVKLVLTRTFLEPDDNVRCLLHRIAIVEERLNFNKVEA